MIAYVKYPNTPKSDSFDRVLHVVETIENGKVEVMATDPINAIEIVDKHLKANGARYELGRILMEKMKGTK
jgi:hypothetical protein